MAAPARPSRVSAPRAAMTAATISAPPGPLASETIPPTADPAASWATTAITAKTAATANATRYVVSVPISDATGKLATVAMKIPALTTAITMTTSFGGG